MAATGIVLIFLIIGLIVGIKSPAFTNDEQFIVAAGEVITVHVVPHSHDDVGWLKTVQQYYDGTN